MELDSRGNFIANGPNWTDSEPAGLKYDDDKLPMHLLSPYLIKGVAEVLQYGAKKYAPRNWEKGIVYSRCFAACMRHMWDWWSGKDTDPETGLSHLKHAACCIMFLIHFSEMNRTEYRKLDDRPWVTLEGHPLGQ